MGLDYLHNKGFIHKDLKPDNLLFDKDGYLKITDFGYTEVIFSTIKIGSLPYMSPEIYKKAPHDKSVDFYALGIICYEVLYEKRPF